MPLQPHDSLCHGSLPFQGGRALFRAVVMLAVLSADRGALADKDSAPLRVEIEGVRGELEDNVRLRLGVIDRQGKSVTESEAHDLHGRAEPEIKQALEPFGYYRPIIRGEISRDEGRWLAKYVIDPGPPLLVDTVDVQITGEGSDDRRLRRFVERFPLRQGDALVHSKFELAKSNLIDIALRNGYLDAKIERSQMRVDLETYRAAVVLHFATGPRYYFGPVRFEQDVVNDDVLQGYVTFSPGEPVDFNRLIEMESALGNSPYFSRVEVRPRTDLAQGSQLPIVVGLVPSKPRKLTMGVGYGTDNGAHVHSRLELRRINRRGHRGEIEGTASMIERSAAAKYLIPWPYPRTDLLTYAIGYVRTETETSEEETGLAGVTWSRAPTNWQETYSVTFRRERFTVGLDQGLSNFLLPEATWSRMSSDSPIAPANGRRLRLHLVGAHEQVLSAASYVRLDTQGKWVRAFGRRHRLNGRAEAGMNWTQSFRELPPSARFFAGGAQSVRGFGYNELGSRDEAGNVIGGEMLAVASIEYEHRFKRRWGGAVFYDIGNALTSFSERLAQGAGVGVRWLSPVGLVRADVAFPLTDRAHRPHFHLSIGPSL